MTPTHGHISTTRFRDVLRQFLKYDVVNDSPVPSGSADMSLHSVFIRDLQLAAVKAQKQGKHAEAIALLRRAVEFSPTAPECRNNLAVALAIVGQHDEAIVHLKLAIAQRPRYVEAIKNLAAAQGSLGKHGEARKLFEDAVLLEPGDMAARLGLCGALFKMGEIDNAVDQCEQLIAREPTNAAAYHLLSTLYCEQARASAAVQALRRRYELQPESARAGSDYLFALHYTESEPDHVLSEHVRWAQVHEKRPVESRKAGCDLGRPLRIGYVSPDFQDHPVGRFLQPVLEHRDAESFQVTCFSDVRRPDMVTARLKSLSDRWHDTGRMSDEELVYLVKAEEIDVLVDLTGHGNGNRLLVFARKPCPVQVSAIGYPDTTGLLSIDWRLTDERADPAGSDAFYTERQYRVSGCAWCFSPDEAFPEVGPLPAETKNFITYGCLNRVAKVTTGVMSWWAQILRLVPTSRLVICATGGDAGNREVRNMLESNGVEGARLTILPKAPTRREYLARFNEIDICLDTFPYHGTATTCDALWMGVPVITLAGNSHVSRVGVSLLEAAGLKGNVAASPEQYVAMAVQEAQEIRMLAETRNSLRSKLQQSSLMDARSYAKRIEEMFLEICKFRIAEA